MHLLASGDMEILVVCDIGAAYCEATVVAALGKLVEVEHFFPARIFPAPRTAQANPQPDAFLRAHRHDEGAARLSCGSPGGAGQEQRWQADRGSRYGQDPRGEARRGFRATVREVE